MHPSPSTTDPVSWLKLPVFSIELLQHGTSSFDGSNPFAMLPSPCVPARPMSPEWPCGIAFLWLQVLQEVSKSGGKLDLTLTKVLLAFCPLCHLTSLWLSSFLMILPKTTDVLSIGR